MKQVESIKVHPVNPSLGYKYILITLVILMIGTLLVAVFALTADYKHMKDMSELREQILSTQYNSQLATQMLRETRAASANTKCKTLSQDELPAANLYGSYPAVVNKEDLEDVEDGKELGRYKWLTDKYRYGFISGGMKFDNSTGNLHIPRNGTYYMYTTIRFLVNKKLQFNLDGLTVSIKISSSCNSHHPSHRATSVNPTQYVFIPQGSQPHTSYSVHTSGIARLCENDYIYLKIDGMPRDVKIKNRGIIQDAHRTNAKTPTNFGAFMIASSCEDDATAPVSSNASPISSNTTEPTESTTSSTASTTAPTTNSRCRRRTC